MKKIIGIILALLLISSITCSTAALEGEWAPIGGGSSGGSQGSGQNGSQSGYNPTYNPNSYYPSWVYSNPDEDDVFVAEDDESDDIDVNDTDIDDISADDGDYGSSDSILVEDPIEPIVIDCE